MSQSIFLDASAWFAALSPRDQWHAEALRLYSEATRAGSTFVTTTLVVAEVHALLLRWRTPDIGHRFLDAVFSTPAHVVIAADLDVIRGAVLRWIAGYRDQSFTLCDAVSFEVMSRERIGRALSFDQHFAVAGFEQVGAR